MEACVECVADIVGCTSCVTPQPPAPGPFPDCPSAVAPLVPPLSPTVGERAVDGVLPPTGSGVGVGGV